MVRAPSSPLVRSANANRKSTMANEAVSVVKRGKRGSNTYGALFGRRMGRSIEPNGAWTELETPGCLSAPFTHTAGFIFFCSCGPFKEGHGTQRTRIRKSAGWAEIIP